MSQRKSDPQVIAADLDEILPVLIRKLGEDKRYDEEDMLIIRGLRSVSLRQLHHAEVFDLGVSLTRVGMNKRNARRMRELFPDLDEAS